MRETVFTAEATPIVFGPVASEKTGFYLARSGSPSTPPPSQTSTR